MIHPQTELRYVNKLVGYGVFATQFIPKGTIIWALDELDQHYEEDYVISLDLIRRKQIIKYCYRDNKGRYVLCWDIARYMNHSFSPNCISTVYEFELAIRDIYPGEQLTEDYGYFNLDEPFYCLPEEGSTRTKVMPDDILHYYPEWDRKATEAMRCINRVAQPLAYLIAPKYIDIVHAVAEGQKPIDSLRNYYYDRAISLKTVSTMSA
jgi:uncharacterized protein